MFSIHDRPSKLCDGLSRRELLQIGGLGVAGLSLPRLLEAQDTLPVGVLPTDKTYGRAKNVIFLYLAGGPPQHETFDPKPNAPAEIRGLFKPVSTNVPGMQFCELLPRTSHLADKLAVIRSMSTNDNVHSSSGYWVLTGYKYQGPNARMIQPTDWPYFGSIVKSQKPSEVLPPLSTVWIPDMMRLNESVTPAGQTAGFMGQQWDPDRFIGNPADPNYKVEGLRLSELSPMRLKQRQSLLSQVEKHFDAAKRGEAVNLYNGYQQQAFDLMTSTKARDAFDLKKEPRKVRERYGMNRWGQCVLLSRRLVEAGVRLVHVHWPREPGDNAVDNPLWDTHAQNAERLEDVLCPQFDVGFSALVEDLDRRGLLDETLVVTVGEFGRTPKINAKGGRDHWGAVFSVAMAGAGISGGQVYGASDRQGAYPAENRVEPGHLTATLFHLLGINWQGTFSDREGREHKLTTQEPLLKLLGTRSAATRLVTCTADINRVPPFDNEMLRNTDFESSAPLRSLEGLARPRGWRGASLLESPAGNQLGVRITDADAGNSRGGKRHVVMGMNLGKGEASLKLAKGQHAILAQEVRSPFAGKYAFSIHAAGSASSKEFHENVFLKNFTCKLIFFQFTARSKSPAQRKELASIAFQPTFTAVGKKPVYERFELEKEFLNARAGSNFSFGLGLGVAVIVEKTSDGILELPADGKQQVSIRIDDVELEFTGKARNDDVKV